jgi:serine/threonine protein kinase
MKSVLKKEAVEANQQTAIMNERKQMAFMHLLGVRSPFVPHMMATLTDETSLHLLLDTKVCRPLMAVMQKEGSLSAISEDHARFYLACLTLALENLHHNKIVCRAITPEYIMLNERDCPVLTDFRLAKNVQSGKTFTMCGVPEFLAPEQVTAKGHGVGVDCWALGVILFEMVIGEEPFGGQNETATYNAITSHKAGGAKILAEGKAQLSIECIDLLDGLLDPDQDTRFGSTEVDPEGMHTLRDHAWFKKIDWEKLQNAKEDGPLSEKSLAMVDEMVANGPDDTVTETNEKYTGDTAWFEGF